MNPLPARASAGATALATGGLLGAALLWEWAFFGRLVWGGAELLPFVALPLLVRTRPWAAWVRLLSRREVGTSLALLRIALGLCVVGMLSGLVARGVIEPLWVDSAHGGYRSLGSGGWLVRWLGGPTPAVVWPLVWAAIGSGVLLTLGIGGRWPALAALVFTSSLTNLNSHTGGSYDELLENGLWLCFLSSCTQTISLDCRIRTGAWLSEGLVPAWPRWLVIFQLVLVYWTTGLQKLSAHWVPGGGFSALYYIFQQPTWQRFDMQWVAWVYPLTQIGTGVSWFWEVLAPLWLLAFFYRDTRSRPGRVRALFNAWDVRTLYAALGATFHLMLLIFMDVGPFSPITLAFYTCLWSPDEWRALARRLRRPAAVAAAQPASEAA